MTQFNTQKTTAFYNKITNELISIKGNTVFGTSGSIVLKLYGSFAWTEILAHQLVIELNNIGVYRYGYEDTLRVMSGRDVDGLWKYRSVCEHHELVERVKRMKFKDQQVAVRVPVMSITVDLENVK